MTSNKFREFWTAGYRRLVPIVPPGAPVSELSTLAKRTELLGKIPGVRKDNGEWIGLDLRKCVATEPDLDLWHSWGAGVGIRTGDGLVALDIDTLDEELATQIHGLADLNLGETSTRIGRAPKRLLLYATADTIPYRRVKFAGGLVELLSDDRQFVAHGIHPVTGKPYHWPLGYDRRDALPVVTAASVAEFFAHLAATLPQAEQSVVSTSPAGSAPVDQAQLLGEPEDVARAVAALPNTSALFPSYDDYVRVGYAIKGATQDDSAGLELFQQWAARWIDGDNDPDRVAADWQRMKPPFEVGAQYLFSLAQQHGGFSTGDAWFKAGQSPADSVWDTAPAEQPPSIEPIKWLKPSDWQGKQPPARQWEVDGWIPKGEVTLLYGDGGIGKTLIIHQYATCAAAGLSWLGQATRPAKVMCFFCEDSEDELHRRQIDLCATTGASLNAVDARLRIASRKYMDNLLAVWRRNDGAMQRSAVWQQLRDDAVSFGAEVIIVDTIADTFGGSEIDRGQVNAFIKSCLGRLGQETGASIIVLGHPSVAGKDRGTSGSTAWSNASRSRMYLRYPKGVEEGNVRELKGMKLNYGPKGALLKLAWKSGAFVVLGESKPIDPGLFKSGSVPDLDTMAEALTLAAWSEAGVDELSSAPKAARYSVTVLRCATPEALSPFSDDQITSALRRLMESGAVAMGDKGRLTRCDGGVFN